LTMMTKKLTGEDVDRWIALVRLKRRLLCWILFGQCRYAALML